MFRYDSSFTKSVGDIRRRIRSDIEFPYDDNAEVEEQQRRLFVSNNVNTISMLLSSPPEIVCYNSLILILHNICRMNKQQFKDFLDKFPYLFFFNFMRHATSPRILKLAFMTFSCCTYEGFNEWNDIFTSDNDNFLFVLEKLNDPEFSQYATHILDNLICTDIHFGEELIQHEIFKTISNLEMNPEIANMIAIYCVLLPDYIPQIQSIVPQMLASQDYDVIYYGLVAYIPLSKFYQNEEFVIQLKSIILENMPYYLKLSEAKFIRRLTCTLTIFNDLPIFFIEPILQLMIFKDDEIRKNIMIIIHKNYELWQNIIKSEFLTNFISEAMQNSSYQVGLHGLQAIIKYYDASFIPNPSLIQSTIEYIEDQQISGNIIKFLIAILSKYGTDFIELIKKDLIESCHTITECDNEENAALAGILVSCLEN